MNTFSLQKDFYMGHSPNGLLDTFSSPLYVYNESILRERAKTMKNLIKHPRFYAYFSTKANGNPHLIRILHEEGLRADAMSPGELALLDYAGLSKENIGYVCNNVSPQELLHAAKRAAWVSVDSLAQLETLGQQAPQCKVMVRINPGIGAGHHDKVITAGTKTKFGVSPAELTSMRTILQKYNMQLHGFNQHIGSLFLEPESYVEAAKLLLGIAKDFPDIQAIDFGGGFGIPYNTEREKPLDITRLGTLLSNLITDWCAETGYKGAFYIEPGRYVVAECGRLLGLVHAVKQNTGVTYVGTDIGFSVLMRPVLYDAYHKIHFYQKHPQQSILQTITGNICESGDILAHNRMLPKACVGDIVEVHDTGAYSSSMSSTYNQRLRPAEVLITRDEKLRVVRNSDSLAQILQPYEIHDFSQ